MEELQVALTAVQQDLSVLKEYVAFSLPRRHIQVVQTLTKSTMPFRTRGRSSGLSALLKILFNDSDVLLPQILSNDDAVRFYESHIDPSLILIPILTDYFALSPATTHAKVLSAPFPRRRALP